MSIAQNATNSTLQEEPDENSIITGVAIGGVGILGILVAVIIITVYRRKKRVVIVDHQKLDNTPANEKTPSGFIHINFDQKAHEMENDSPEDNPLKQQKKEAKENQNTRHSNYFTPNKKFLDSNIISSSRELLKDISRSPQKSTGSPQKSFKLKNENEQIVDILQEIQKIPSDAQILKSPQRFKNIKKIVCNTDGNDKRSIPDDDYYEHKFETIQKEIKERGDARKHFAKDEVDIEEKIKKAFEIKENKSDDKKEGSEEANENKIGKDL